MGFKHLYYLLKEASVKDIKDKIDSGRKERSDLIGSHYQSVNKQGTITFKSTAITTPGRDFWEQKIKPHIKPKKGMTLKEFRECYNGDVNVSCDCPDFKYGGYEYIATQDNFKFGKAQMIFPKEKNPQLEGSTCKHLYNCMTVVKFNLNTVKKDFDEL